MSKFFIVLKKELKDIFRDKKSIIATFIIPLLIYPIMMFFLGGGINEMIGTTDDIYVSIIGEMQDDGSYKNLEEKDKDVIYSLFREYNKNVKVDAQKLYVKSVAEPNSALISGDIQLIVMVEDGLNNVFDTFKNFENYNINYMIDYRSNDSISALSTVKILINSFSESIFNLRLQNIVGEDVASYRPITTKEVDFSIDDYVKRTGTDNYLILMIIPMLITVLISVGGSTIAVDLVAGEKERGTFEPLLSTSCSRFSILSAKYLVVIIFAFINGLVQVIAMGIGMALSPNMLLSMSHSGALSLSFGGVVLGIINILLLAAVFSSIMLCLSSTAKTFKEASTKTSFLVFLPLLLSYSVMFVDAVNITMLNMLVPVVNVVCVVKMILSGYVNYAYFSMSMVINLLLLGVAIFITLKTFSKESLITRG